MDEVTKCPKCKTRTLVREGEDLVCSQCHEHFPAPTGGHIPINGRRKKAKKAKLGRSPQQSASKHAYYESNKQQMVTDLLTFGRMPTRKKWNISPSTLSTLEKRWLTPDQKAILDNMTFRPEIQLPQLPEFSNSWDPQVQVKWLEIYGELLKKGR
ncbi:MAG: hypothetical protein MUO80_07455 [Dehalococcoidia bacterium]|nr:hypothetical protein [Dehalococcoidia bacterium]